MYILNYQEYDALDYYMTKSKLYDSGLYLKQEPNKGDYFIDSEENTEYSLDDGLRLIADTFTSSFYEDYPKEVCDSLYKLYKKRGLEI